MGKTTEVNTKSDELSKHERPQTPKPTLSNPKMNLFLSCGVRFWCNELIKNERPMKLGFVYSTQTKKVALYLGFHTLIARSFKF